MHSSLFEINEKCYTHPKNLRHIDSWELLNERPIEKMHGVGTENINVRVQLKNKALGTIVGESEKYFLVSLDGEKKNVMLKIKDVTRLECEKCGEWATNTVFRWNDVKHNGMIHLCSLDWDEMHTRVFNLEENTIGTMMMSSSRKMKKKRAPKTVHFIDERFIVSKVDDTVPLLLGQVQQSTLNDASVLWSGSTEPEIVASTDLLFHTCFCDNPATKMRRNRMGEPMCFCDVHSKISRGDFEQYKFDTVTQFLRNVQEHNNQIVGVRCLYKSKLGTVNALIFGSENDLKGIEIVPDNDPASTLSLPVTEIDFLQCNFTTADHKRCVKYATNSFDVTVQNPQNISVATTDVDKPCCHFCNEHFLEMEGRNVEYFKNVRGFGPLIKKSWYDKTIGSFWKSAPPKFENPKIQGHDYASMDNFGDGSSDIGTRVQVLDSFRGTIVGLARGSQNKTIVWDDTSPPYFSPEASPIVCSQCDKFSTNAILTR